MLLTLSTTHVPATDLGFLLYKNPDAVRSVDLWFGQAHVFYPEATEERCTVALLLDVDPIGLVRRRGRAAEAGSLEPYVNDRPYATSSFMSVALAKLFGTAMGGRSEERPELAMTPIPLEVHIPALSAGKEEGIVQRLFEPLGYRVSARRVMLDDAFPQWGDSEYVDVTLASTVRLSELLSHLYVLLPVLDDRKHYWVSGDEIDKLLRRGEGWLAAHQENELIARRYLRHQEGLAQEALSRLAEEDSEIEQEQEPPDVKLRDQRLQAVVDALKARGATRVLDLGCGDGRLLSLLLKDGSFDRIVGVDVSYASLERAARRVHLDEMAPKQRERIELMQGSVTYNDRRLQGYDAAALVEVVEHLDPSRLVAFENAVFGVARPSTVLVTTPNVEYNVRFAGLPAGSMRHRDHRFEWTRAQFQAWATRTAEENGFGIEFSSIGPEDPQVGSPTQMGLFTR